MAKFIALLAALAAMHISFPAAGATSNPARVQQIGGSRTALEQEVDGVTATFMVMNMKEWLKGRPLPPGFRETHHLLVSFRDSRSGRPLNQGVVKVKVASPDRTEQVKELEFMQWHFGGDFDLSKKGNYGIMTRFKLGDGKVRNVSFWFEVK